ncbi:glycosyltransferase family 4 protein [Verrucomicrobium sp. BvORR034]|uniref:glycosyltransferase family 4 protein n=1 Tax=Verrucomicrobium sp. BvORR034 TaxID=1396418 RepID=UPI0006799F9F|nr:glycosyltransferase family 4 protein [Verrucomicrobium sp. BvORR034]
MKSVANPSSAATPSRLLYATSAGLGGAGLNTTSLEGVLTSWRGGYLSRAICYANRQQEVPAGKVRSLQHHPVRLLSCLGSKDYYAAKKTYLDWQAAQELRRGGYDFFHGWSGECFQSLVEARLRGIPSVMDVPTWHRNKGVVKPAETKKEREARLKDRGWRDWRKHLHATRLHNLAEYDLASVLLMPSRKSAETFLVAGIPEHKLQYVGRGVDLARYRPAEAPPEVFRVGFVGALIQRKGVHHLIEAWKRLRLRDAELVLVGSVHEEIKPFLQGAEEAGVRIIGFTSSVQDELRRCAAFAFPSECEGFAKSTLEAAACGLPLIATRESGDAIVDQETGLLIPPNNVDALCAALEHAAKHRDELAEMGRKARALVEREFTWDHYRQRIASGYARALATGY